MGGLVDEINQTARQVAGLNKEIAQVLGAGDRPNDLLDRRDRLLDRLAEIGGAVSYEQANGQVTVSIGGHALVVAGSTFSIEFSNQAAEKAADRLSWSDGQKFSLAGGDLAGLIAVHDQDLQVQLDGLDGLAAALIQKVNTAHQAGVGLDGSTGLKLFDGAGAATIALSLDIRAAANPLDKIAAAGSGGAVGDGSVALAIAGIQSQAFITSDPAPGPGSVYRTLGESCLAQIAGLGQSIQQAQGNGEAQQLIAAALRRQRESASGVSLDEEAANLVKYQRTYQALSRLVTSIDEMLDQVINGMGRVGR
jgi:flagellar hook-associated protein 1 FlgK